MPLRRRGFQAHRHPDRRRPPDRTGDRFEALVEQALERLPPPIAELLEGVAIVIDDEPTPEQRVENRLGPDQSLYGLYEGTPRSAYAADWAPFPNKITLFRLPLEEDFPDPAALEAQVRRTVQHELAHHLGFGESRLHELGLD